MTIRLADWIFQVDTEETANYTINCASDHCMCAYCRNFYETVDLAHPTLRPFLKQFGAVAEGPSEVMPLEPALILACYRITGKILCTGSKIHVDGVPIHPESAEDGTFLLWIGEMPLPWVQNEPAEDVVSPANQPEFLQRMQEKWVELNDFEPIYS